MMQRNKRPGRNKASHHVSFIAALLLSTTVSAGVIGPQYAVIHYSRADGDYGDHTTGNFNDFWGLHLWGDGIDSNELTSWTSPKPFLGETDYGRFAWVKLAPDPGPVNFIIHRGDVKDGTPADRSFDSGTSTEIWTRGGDGSEYTTQAAASGYTRIHYHRDDGNYGNPASSDFNDFWGLHLWGDAIDPTVATTSWQQPLKPTGVDAFGVYFDVALIDPSKPVNFILHRGDTKDTPADQSFVPNDSADIWMNSGDATIHSQRGEAEDVATIHYHRSNGDYGNPASSDYNDFWGMHVWNGAQTQTGWTDPLRPDGFDLFGATFEVSLIDAADELAYILHRGDTKDPGPDQFLDFSKYGYEVWQLEGADPGSPYVLPVGSFSRMTSIPEPSMWALLCAGLFGLWLSDRSRGGTPVARWLRCSRAKSRRAPWI